MSARTMSDSQRITRQEMLDRVRGALERAGPPDVAPVPPEVDDAVVRTVAGDDDLVAVFAQRAEAVNAVVHRCTAAELADAAVRVLGEVGARRIVMATPRLAGAEALAETLRRSGVELLDWQGDPQMRAGYEADAGLTDVHAAIAETGSIVCEADDAHGRGLSLAPPVHVAVVRRSDIVPDLLDYQRQLRATPPEQATSSRSIITGPSKTADIEGVLITGVHGPGQVIVLLVGDA